MDQPGLQPVRPAAHQRYLHDACWPAMMRAAGALGALISGSASWGQMGPASEEFEACCRAVALLDSADPDVASPPFADQSVQQFR
jgi:hypothetical protein